MIPITDVRVDERAEQLVLDVLRSGQLAQGVYVAQFEDLFAALHHVRHAIAVNNGTTALIAAFEALGVGPGDEVITTPFTFVATLNAVLRTGASVRFADIGSDFNIDADAISELVTARTRAILPVHLYGQMADMAAISGICQRGGLHLVEDAAQAVGASFRGSPAGSFGTGCFSLYATKNVSTGEGGVITTNDDELADHLRLLRNQGMRERYRYEMVGQNYRLTNLAAAVGIPQLERIQEINERRRANAEVLSDGLSALPGIIVPSTHPDREHVFHQYTVRVTADAPVARDEFVAALNDRGVGAGVYYPRVVFDYECYRGHPQVQVDDVPEAYRAAAEVVSLPVHPFLSTTDLEVIIEACRSVLRGRP